MTLLKVGIGKLQSVESQNSKIQDWMRICDAKLGNLQSCIQEKFEYDIYYIVNNIHYYKT